MIHFAVPLFFEELLEPDRLEEPDSLFEPEPEPECDPEPPPDPEPLPKMVAPEICEDGEEEDDLPDGVGTNGFSPKLAERYVMSGFTCTARSYTELVDGEPFGTR